MVQFYRWKVLTRIYYQNNSDFINMCLPFKNYLKVKLFYLSNFKRTLPQHKSLDWTKRYTKRKHFYLDCGSNGKMNN